MIRRGGLIITRKHANLLNNIGNVYNVLGKYDEAKINYEKSLEIDRNIFKTDNHPSIASIFNNIACVYNRLGINDEALVYFDKSLEINRNFFQSDDHPSIARTLINRAGIFYLNRRGQETRRIDVVNALEFFMI